VDNYVKAAQIAAHQASQSSHLAFWAAMITAAATIISVICLSVTNHKIVRLELFKQVFPEKVAAAKELFKSSRSLHETFFQIARPKHDHAHRDIAPNDEEQLKTFKQLLIYNVCWFDNRVDKLGQEYIQYCEGLLGYPGKEVPTDTMLEERFQKFRQLLRTEIQIERLERQTGKLGSFLSRVFSWH